MSNLQGKTALVTGGSRGIGRASALALANAGARVLIHYNTGASEAEDVASHIRRSGGRAEIFCAELSAPEAPHALAGQIREACGARLDILVANAGISKRASIEETTLEDFDQVFAINVRAPFFLVQQLLPVMGDGASIILLSSVVAHTAIGVLPAYSATKGAINTMVGHFAAELGPRGIRVNAVAPGVVVTDMSRFTQTDAGRAKALGWQALKRLAHPEDIGDVIAFLASDAARWISGDILRVDGGSKL